MKMFIKGFIFMTGVITGTTVSALYFKKKYETIANSKIETTAAFYERKISKLKELNESKESDISDDINKEDEPIVENVEITNKINDISENKQKKSEYTNYIENLGYKTKEERMELPYIITEEEYAAKPDYDISILTYYAGDEILADKDDEIIEDVSYLVGYDFITEFDDDNVVFVRNDRLKQDFEISRVFENYYDEN